MKSKQHISQKVTTAVFAYLQANALSSLVKTNLLFVTVINFSCIQINLQSTVFPLPSPFPRTHVSERLGSSENASAGARDLAAEDGLSVERHLHVTSAAERVAPRLVVVLQEREQE